MPIAARQRFQGGITALMAFMAYTNLSRFFIAYHPPLRTPQQLLSV
jgi:hypothetical protein